MSELLDIPVEIHSIWHAGSYDANDFFHMNWGWSGNNNGYFSINSLKISASIEPSTMIKSSIPFFLRSS